MLGIIFTVILYWYCNFYDYQEALMLGGLEIDVHAPIASWSMPTIKTICVIGIISYILIRNKKLDLPPLIIIISMSGIWVCTVLSLVFILQILKM